MIALLEYLGTTDHFVFESWFCNMLLKELPQGATIVMDHASFHRKKTLYKLVGQANCEVLFLPAYSPDLNPIERSWANLKSFF